MKAETEVMQPRPRKSKDAGRHQKAPERQKTDALLEPREGTNPADNLISDLWPPAL